MPVKGGHKTGIFGSVKKLNVTQGGPWLGLGLECFKMYSNSYRILAVGMK
jgi:hypothetical protein